MLTASSHHVDLALMFSQLRVQLDYQLDRKSQSRLRRIPVAGVADHHIACKYLYTAGWLVV
jgi:hypothetical protein